MVYNNSTKRTRNSSAPTSGIITTHPLALRKDGTWFAYGWDLTKNICEVFGPAGYIRTAYTYSPYGSVIVTGDVTQPIQWSSEYNDAETSLVYYNYRHYSPVDGRWISRDRIEEESSFLLYQMAFNNTILQNDHIGNASYTKIACCALAATLSIWETYDSLTGDACIGETGADYVKCMISNVVIAALGASSVAAITCCVHRNIEKGDIEGARQCIQDEIDSILRNFLHITAITCCIGPNMLPIIGKAAKESMFQQIKNLSPKPCCP